MSASTDLVADTETTTMYVVSVEQRLQQIMAEQRHCAASPQLDHLWSRIAGVIGGGKRTRPLLVHLAHQAFGGGDPGPALNVGCAFELLHTGLLIHDDVIDRDFIRRGRPTVSAAYRDAALQRGEENGEAAHTGNSAAIIAGDLLISQATRLLYRAVRATPYEQAVVETFHQAIDDSAAGELTDLILAEETAAGSIAEILQMHRLKTAAYSFEAPLRIGALLAGASEQQAENIAAMGKHLGIGYQIMDDVLGTFGDPQVTGKPIDSDLREGKQTVLMAIAAEDPQLAPHLHLWRSGTLSSQQLRSQFITHGVEDQARRLIQQHHSASCAVLDRLPITDRGRGQLQLVIDNTLNRSA